MYYLAYLFFSLTNRKLQSKLLQLSYLKFCPLQRANALFSCSSNLLSVALCWIEFI